MVTEPRRPKVRDLARLWRALKLVWKVAPGWTAASTVVTIASGLVPLATIWLLKLIVDAIADGIGAADHAAAFRHVAVLIGLAAAVGLITAVLRSVATMVDGALGRTVTDHVMDVIHSQSIAVDLEYYENAHYHDALYRAQQEAPYRPTSIVRNLTATLQALVTVLAMAGLLLTLHWAVGLIVLCAAIPGGVVRFLYSKKLFAWQTRRTEMERQAFYAHWVLTDTAYAKEVRLLALGDRFRARYREVRSLLRRELIALSGRQALAEFAAGVAAVAAVFGTFAYIAWRAIEGSIGIGLVVAYYQAFQTSLGALQGMLRGLTSLYEDNLFLAYYEEFMSLEPHISAPERPLTVPRPLTEGIRYVDVDFSYPDTERTALRSVSLTIRPGEITALVGPNGSGKTTLVKLLCRLYDPSGGSVTLDGVDLRSFDPVDVRSNLSVIFQDFAHYQLTVRENIRLGNGELAADDPAIVAAAKDAGVHDAILRLRGGYDAMLGKWFEDGEELSVGEWQKMALARAFVRDAQILVLDEPTASLDPRAEWEVFEHIRRLARGRAVVLISHRFSTVRAADRIHIFDDGRIIESGTHDELMALGGRYADMYEVQAKAYRTG